MFKLAWQFFKGLAAFLAVLFLLAVAALVVLGLFLIPYRPLDPWVKVIFLILGASGVYHLLKAWGRGEL
jgi:hypothetical protein